jgi:adenosylcobinamide-phosphate synthase
MSLLLAIVLALGLDYWLGEPKRLHPLVGFGAFADGLEKWLNAGQGSQLKGTLALLIAVGPLGFIAYSLEASLALSSVLSTLFAGVVLYLAIGWRSLIQHAKAISIPLAAGDLATAREAVGHIVSRDTHNLNESEIAKAAAESVLENGADAVFAALFWFAVAGVPGVVIYRLSNTLDAMWGYKNQRFLQFGWAAARFDDLLNFIPARLTALAYTLCGARTGNSSNAWRSWREQAGTWKSPNAGPVMAAGAGAIGVELGGAAQYQGQNQERPSLGAGVAPTAQSINDACALVNHSLALWLASLVLLAWLGLIS